MSTDDNVYGTWAGEPANEDNLTPEQEQELSEQYSYSDGYKH